jgi:hypothetical protein
VTDLQRLYFQHRNRGDSHHAACRAIARAHGIDAATINRTLRRAGTKPWTPIPEDLPASSGFRGSEGAKPASGAGGGAAAGTRAESTPTNRRR